MILIKDVEERILRAKENILVDYAAKHRARSAVTSTVALNKDCIAVVAA